MKGKIMISFIILLFMMFFLKKIDLIAVDIIEVKQQSIEENENNEMITFWTSLCIIGGVIGCTLAYVSFRKYKAEKRKRSKDQIID